MADDLIERLRSTLPVCPFDQRSPDYWTAGKDGAPCTVCGTTEDGPDKCRGADTRCMAEAADALASMTTSIRSILSEAKKALEYSSSSLESIESYDEEDRAEDGGSKACKACVKINNRAIAKIDAFLKAGGATP